MAKPLDKDQIFVFVCFPSTTLEMELEVTKNVAIRVWCEQIRDSENETRFVKT